jgi:Ca-activated chloride channel family protein
MLMVLLGLVAIKGARAQENPLGDVKTPTPAPPTEPKDTRPLITGHDVGVKATSAPNAEIRVNVNLVLVPLTVTDPMNRLVTGLEKENFQVFDNNNQQTIKSFATEDAPLSIGIIFDLSGSMTSKFLRARKALTEFLRTCNPQDEFFVVGFNDRPAILVDYTSDVEDVEARMVMDGADRRDVPGGEPAAAGEVCAQGAAGDLGWRGQPEPVYGGRAGEGGARERGADLFDRDL